MQISVTLTEQEAENLAQLLDVAVKAGGIQAAKVAVPLMNKLMAAVNEKPEDQP